MLALLAFAGGTLATVDVVQRRVLDAELRAVAGAETATVDIAADGTIDAPDRQQFNSAAGAHVASAIVTPDGRILVASTSNIPKTIVQTAATVLRSFTATQSDRGENVRATFEPLFNAGRHVATVAVWSDAAAIMALDRNLGIAFAIAIPLFGMTTTLVCSAIARKILLPLEQIIADASEIVEHDGRARVTSPQSTELSRLATALNRMLERLGQAFERERRFSGDASHELRAPLAIILAEADLALASERSTAEYRRALETIAIEADGLESLTRNLLATARADAGSLAFVETVNVTDVAASVIARLRILAAARHITFESSLEAEATVQGDTDQIEQAVLTIVHNAVKYAATNGSIIITLTARDDKIDLSVADDGPGFSANALEHAFDRFWHENDRDVEQVGHGLGLAIARSIVERYHGRIVLANRPAGGGSVTVSFPRSAYG